MRVNRIPLIAAGVAMALIACERSAPTAAGMDTQVTCETGCVGVSVTPDGDALEVPANSSGNTATFFVHNTSTQPQTYTLTCSSTGSVVCTDLDLTSVSLDPGTQVDVMATFSIDAVRGTLKLTAAGGGSDTGLYKVFTL